MGFRQNHEIEDSTLTYGRASEWQFLIAAQAARDPLLVETHIALNRCPVFVRCLIVPILLPKLDAEPFARYRQTKSCKRGLLTSQQPPSRQTVQKLDERNGDVFMLTTHRSADKAEPGQHHQPDRRLGNRTRRDERQLPAERAVAPREPRDGEGIQCATSDRNTARERGLIEPPCEAGDRGSHAVNRNRAEIQVVHASQDAGAGCDRPASQARRREREGENVGKVTSCNGRVPDERRIGALRTGRHGEIRCTWRETLCACWACYRGRRLRRGSGHKCGDRGKCRKCYALHTRTPMQTRTASGPHMPIKNLRNYTRVFFNPLLIFLSRATLPHVRSQTWNGRFAWVGRHRLVAAS